MQIDRVEKKQVTDERGNSYEALLVRLVNIDADGKRSYHRTSFDARISPRILREVESHLEGKGWGRFSDMDRTLIHQAVEQLFTPEVEPEPQRPPPVLQRTWKKVRGLLGVD